MKTLKVLSVIAKIVMAIFAIVAVVMSIATAIVGTIYDSHLHDVVVESNHDEDQEDIISKALSLTLADPRLRRNKIISAVSYGAAKVVSFVAHL